MKIWKIILIVWSPVVVLGLIYGGIYFIHYEHANNLKKKAQAVYNDCITPKYPSDGVGIPFVPNCQNVGFIEHGFMGWPGYKAGSY